MEDLPFYIICMKFSIDVLLESSINSCIVHTPAYLNAANLLSSLTLLRGNKANLY